MLTTDQLIDVFADLDIEPRVLAHPDMPDIGFFCVHGDHDRRLAFIPLAVGVMVREDDGTLVRDAIVHGWEFVLTEGPALVCVAPLVSAAQAARLLKRILSDGSTFRL